MNANESLACRACTIRPAGYRFRLPALHCVFLQPFEKLGWILVDVCVKGIVADLIYAPIGTANHLRGFLMVEWSCSNATKDGELIARFIDRSVSIDASRNAEGMAFLGEFACRDQAGCGPRRKAVIARRFGTGKLHHSKPIASVGDVSELTDVGDAQA